MPDVKKLITGFLIIAAAASTSALVLSNLDGNNSAVAQTNAIASGTPSLTDQNAFVPTKDVVTDAVINSNPDIAAALNDPANLTANFTTAFLNGVAVANPEGLNTDANGNATIQSPNAQTVAVLLAQSSAVKNFKAPDWGAEAAAQKINISSSATVSAYSDALNNSFNTNLIQGGVGNLVNQQDLDPSNFEAVESPLQNTLTETIQTPTPAKLVPFQKSLVAMLVYEKNMVALADEAQTDPVKASLIYQAEESKYDQVIENFGVQSQKVSAEGIFSFDQVPSKANPAIALLQSYLGVPTAHAQWPTFDAANFAKWIQQEVETVILQIVKNTLVAFIQQRVLTWIKGSGAPLFVQQFGAQLANLAQAKAVSALASVLPGYTASCPNIGKLLSQTTLNLGLTAPVKNVPTCNIPAVSVAQLGNFYKNFNINANAVPGGNWGLYAQILNPNNNYYGALLQTNDYVGSQVAGAVSAGQTQQIATQGIKGQAACDDGSNPNGSSIECVDEDGGIYYTLQDGSCPAGTFAGQGGANNGLCADGTEPIITTPGQVTKTVTDNALGGALQLTVNANSIEGVLASIATSLLNTVVQAGIGAVAKTATQGLTSIILSSTAGSPSTNGGTAPTTPTAPTNLPPLPRTTCATPTPCESGTGGVGQNQCVSGSLGDMIQFAATGGDGTDYTWTPEPPAGITASPSTGSSAEFDVSFTATSGIFANQSESTATGTSTITIPVKVTEAIT